MCGIAGFLEFSNCRAAGRAGLEAAARAMADTIAHRGPDDSGVWADERWQVALGFRRLAIVDLSPGGRQPMESAGGRFVLVFNGEIYNHRELRSELAAVGVSFRGNSDTEVLLAAIEQWGLEPALAQCVGMFAFALWDRHERSLHLVRDRLGEKPLYYALVGGTLLFGSEIKALRAHEAFDDELDRHALAAYLRHAYVPGPHSIYRHVRKLPPGCLLTVAAGTAAPRCLEPRAYWSAAEAFQRGAEQPHRGSDEEIVEEFTALLTAAIGQQMVADVPLGAFLSGGIDSSTIVALMQRQSSRPVKTFTIGFHEAAYDEARHARAVARHLGTDHTELYVTAKQARDVIPRLPRLYDEPLADASQIPTYLVAELARSQVTVSLSGDGGDELFCGYARYLATRSFWRGVRWLPTGLRAALGRQLVRRPGLAAAPSGSLGRKLFWAGQLLGCESPLAVYRQLVSHWPDPAVAVAGAHEAATIFTDPRRAVAVEGLERQMMLADLGSYLPDNILVKVDRATMGVGLESRAPLLDHRLVELAARLPLRMLVRRGQGKWLLRQVLYRHVPRHLVERPKMGFGVPLNAWLRGPLRQWAEDLLSESTLRRDGLFNPAVVRAKWTEHLSGAGNWSACLWPVLMFQQWKSEQAQAAVWKKSA